MSSFWDSRPCVPPVGARPIRTRCSTRVYTKETDGPFLYVPRPGRCERIAGEGERGPGLAREEDEMPNTDEEISRTGFLKLGGLGISATALAFAAGRGGEEDDERTKTRVVLPGALP